MKNAPDDFPCLIRSFSTRVALMDVFIPQRRALFNFLPAVGARANATNDAIRLMEDSSREANAGVDLLRNKCDWTAGN